MCKKKEPDDRKKMVQDELDRFAAVFGDSSNINASSFSAVTTLFLATVDPCIVDDVIAAIKEKYSEMILGTHY